MRITATNLRSLYLVFSGDIYYDGVEFVDIRGGNKIVPFHAAYILYKHGLVEINYNSFYAKRLLEPTKFAGCFYSKIQNYIVTILNLKEETFFDNIERYLKRYETVAAFQRFWRECTDQIKKASDNHKN